MEQKPECCCKFPTDRMIKVFWPGLQPEAVNKFSRAEKSPPATRQQIHVFRQSRSSKERSCTA